MHISVQPVSGPTVGWPVTPKSYSLDGEMPETYCESSLRVSINSSHIPSVATTSCQFLSSDRRRRNNSKARDTERETVFIQVPPRLDNSKYQNELLKPNLQQNLPAFPSPSPPCTQVLPHVFKFFLFFFLFFFFFLKILLKSFCLKFIS